MIKGSGSSSSSYGWGAQSGYRQDSGSGQGDCGLVLMGARWYDPATGRFTSRELRSSVGLKEISLSLLSSEEAALNQLPTGNQVFIEILASILAVFCFAALLRWYLSVARTLFKMGTEHRTRLFALWLSCNLLIVIGVSLSVYFFSRHYHIAERAEQSGSYAPLILTLVVFVAVAGALMMLLGVFLGRWGSPPFPEGEDAHTHTETPPSELSAGVWPPPPHR